MLLAAGLPESDIADEGWRHIIEYKAERLDLQEIASTNGIAGDGTESDIIRRIIEHCKHHGIEG